MDRSRGLMNLTDFHAKYFAHELTKRSPSDSVEMLAGVLADAQVNLNPFSQNEIVLCSYQFARSKEPYVRQVAWDLVVIDEAHRLRNVYKTSSRIALAIKQAVSSFPKVLLTATPLQNSLLELYGLVSIIDDYAFGDLKSFRTRFARLGNQTDFAELKERLAPIC